MAQKTSLLTQGLTAGAAALLLMASAAIANAQALPRLTGQVDSSSMVALPNSVHPWARAEFDRGAVPGAQSGRMLLVLGRSEEQERDLQQFMAAQQDPASPSYHKWMTPDEFGKRFGAADSDIQTIRGYLSARGMNVGRVASNRLSIEVTATADQIRSTFGTQIHAYAVGGKTFYANNSAPRIPAALAPVVRGFSLNNFRAETGAPAHEGTLDLSTHKIKPLYTTGGGTIFGVTPGDLAKIYNVPAATGVGLGGSNVSVGVIGDSNINVSFVNNYRTIFGLPSSPITVVVDGNDPGVTGDAYIAYKQLELLSAVAPKANLFYYTSATTDYDTGINFALARAVEDNQIQVLVVGYQACESVVGKMAGEATFINQLYEQAAAQGITVVAASGNSGPAGCEIPGTAGNATTGFAVNEYASSPFVTAVGGTDFFYAGSPTPTYWSTTNSTTYASATGYIPEQAWNDSTNLTNPSVILAGGGGVSTVGLDGTSTQQPIPSYQSGNVQAALISNTARILPDVSFFAGSGANDTLGYNSTAYLFCLKATDCTGTTPSFTYSGGTEASAAVFAGAVALTVENKNAGTRYGLGNVNPALYSLLTGLTVVHHDIITGNTKIACSGSNNCSGGQMTGYAAGIGYDAATGLGSFDISSLVTNFTSPATVASTVTLSVLDPATGLAPVCTKVVAGVTQTTPNCAAHSASLKFVVKATSASGTGATPTGDVSIFDSSPLAAQQTVETLTLSNGTATETGYNQLPGGTYKMYARYAGDSVKGGTYAPSTSAPYQITIQPEPCFIQIYKNNISGSGATIAYGSPVVITAEAYSTTNPSNVGIDSGSINVLDTFGGVQRVITTIPVNSQGSATFNSNLLAYGTHSIVLSYNGDASFGACQTPAFGVTVSKAATTTTINAAETDTGAGTASIGVTAVVQSATLPSNATSPTGTVTFNTVTPKVVTLVPGFDQNGNAIATASTTVGQADVPASGVINATYTPGTTETNYTGSTSSGVTFYSTTAKKNLATTTSFTITDTYGLSNNYPALDSLTLQLHVRATNPENSFFIVYANGIQLTPPITKVGGFSHGGLPIDINGNATFVMPQLNGYLNLPSGQVQIDVVYDGWATDTLSTESDPSNATQTITIVDDRTSADFSLQSDLTVNQQNPLISPTTQATFNLRLTSIYNFQSAYSTTPINLSCAVTGYISPTGVHSTPAGLACGFNSALSTTTSSVTFAGSSSTPGFITLPLYVGAAANYTVAANTVPALPGSPWWFATGSTTLACLFLFGLSGRRRQWQSMLGAVALMVIGFGMTGCGATYDKGGSGTYPPKGTATGSNGTTGTAVPAGTYTVVVTATSTTNQTVTHTLPVQVVVGAYN